MTKWPVRLDVDALNDVLNDHRPKADRPIDLVREVSPGRARLVHEFRPEMLRSGGTISGATLMSFADTAGYVIMLAHVGAELMAMTSSLTINFLRAAKPGELHADVELLWLGRRNAVSDVRIWAETPDRPAAQATVTFARPVASA